MSPTVLPVPEPDTEEVVVWRHTLSIDCQSTRLQSFAKMPPAWFLKFGKLLYWVAVVLFWSLIVHRGVQSGRLDIFSKTFWESGLITAMTWVGVILLCIGLFYLSKSFRTKGPKIELASGIPVWMSARRLVFNPSLHIPTTMLDIKDIRSISTSYIMGSPTLCIRTPADTFNLISSETRSLLQHLYTLRPDLEPTS